MERKQGQLALAGDAAQSNVPEGFYFLNSEDARKVLVDVWGNPDSTGESVLGMLFPANANPLSLKKFGIFIITGIGALIRKLWSGRKAKTES